MTALANNDVRLIARDAGFARVLERGAQSFALAGGAIFLGLIAMSIVSIIGRKLAASPVQGDVELMQMGAAIGSAAFLPLCAVRDLHIKIDVITSWLPRRLRDGLDVLAHTLMLIMAGIISWRTALQALADYRSGEETQLLAVPMWIPTGLLVPSFVLFTLCCGVRIATSYQRFKERP